MRQGWRENRVGWFLEAGSHDLPEYFASDAYKSKDDTVKLQECRAALKHGLALLIEPSEEAYIEINNDNMKLIYKEALRLSHEMAKANPELTVKELDNLLAESVSQHNADPNAQNKQMLNQWDSSVYPNILTDLKKEFAANRPAPEVVVNAGQLQPPEPLQPPQVQPQQPPQQNQPQPIPTVQTHLDNIGYELEESNDGRWEYIKGEYKAALKIVGEEGKAKLQADIIKEYPYIELEFRVNVFEEDPQKAVEKMGAEKANKEYVALLNKLSMEIIAQGLVMADHYVEIARTYGEIERHIRDNPGSGNLDDVKANILYATKDKVELEMRIREILFQETPQQIADAVAGRMYDKLSGCIRAGESEEFKRLFALCPKELKDKLLVNQKPKADGAKNLLYEAMMSGNETVYTILKNENPNLAKSLIFDSVYNGKEGGEPFVDGQSPPVAQGAALKFFQEEIAGIVRNSSTQEINDNRLLNIAAYFGATEAVSEALKKGADPSLKGSRSSNALNVAVNTSSTPKDLSFKHESYLLIENKLFDLIENGAIEDRTRYRNAIADSGALRYLYDDGSLEDFEKFLSDAKRCNVPLTVRRPKGKDENGKGQEPREGKLLEESLLEDEISVWFQPFVLAGNDPEKSKMVLEKFELLVDAGIIDIRAIDRLQGEARRRAVAQINTFKELNPDVVKALDYAEAIEKVKANEAVGQAEDKRQSGLNKLRTKLVAEPEKQLAETQAKWMATLKTPEPTAGMTPQQVEELERNKLKSAALKRMMLFYGCSGLSIDGHSLDASNRVSPTTPRVSAEENNLPIGAYLSGNMGRCYVDLEGGPSSDAVLKYITTGDPKSSDGIHLDRHLMAKNRENELTGQQIVFDRHSATHAGVREKGVYKENKSFGFGAKGFLEGVAYKIRSPFRDKDWKENHHTKHMGMNIAAGGLGNSHYSAAEAIKGSGEDGHMYFNTGTKSFGAGLEATAPGTIGPLGEHSKTGAADEFTPFEGAKYAIAKKNTNGLKELFEAQIKLLLPKDPGLLEKLENAGLKVDMDGNITDTKSFKKFLNKDERINGVCNLLDLKTYHKGSLHVVTPYGKWVMEQGIAIQNNYSGALGKVNDDRFQAIMAQKTEIPDEIVYFKPRNDIGEFMAQEEIYKNIDEKPLLKAHPELSYEASNMIGRIYNELPNPQAKAALTLLEEYMSDPGFSRQALHNIGVEVQNKDIQYVRLALSAAASVAVPVTPAVAVAAPVAVPVTPAIPVAAPVAVPVIPAVPVAIPVTVAPPAAPAKAPVVVPPPPPPSAAVKSAKASVVPPPPPVKSAKAAVVPPPARVAPPPPPSKPATTAAVKPQVTKNAEEEIKPKSRITQMAKVAGGIGAIGVLSAIAFGVCLAVSLFVPGAQVALPFLLGGAAIGIGGGAAIGAVAGVLKLGDMAIEGIKSVTSSQAKPAPAVPTPPIAPQKTPSLPPPPPLTPSATPAKSTTPQPGRIR